MSAPVAVTEWLRDVFLRPPYSRRRMRRLVQLQLMISARRRAVMILCDAGDFEAAAAVSTAPYDTKD